jgi:hypothetical protein
MLDLPVGPRTFSKFEQDSITNLKRTIEQRTLLLQNMQDSTMTKEDSEKTIMTTEEDEKTKAPEGKKSTVGAEKEQQPPVYLTQISARLDEVVLKGVAKPVNRSSELVPLSQDFDQMRKRLRSLIVGAKQYHTASVQVEKARMEVRIL